MELKILRSHYWLNKWTGKTEKRGQLAQILHKALMTFCNVQCAKLLNKHCLILLQKSWWMEYFPAVQMKKGLCVWFSTYLSSLDRMETPRESVLFIYSACPSLIG